MNDSKPVLGPLLELLKSRKALTALIVATLNLLVVFVPSLEPYRPELLEFSLALTTVLAAVLVGSIAAEDIASIKAQASITIAQLAVQKVSDDQPDQSQPHR